MPLEKRNPFMTNKAAPLAVAAGKLKASDPEADLINCKK